jgi:hypothetical protein
MAKSKSEVELNATIHKEQIAAQTRKKEILKTYREEEKVAIHISPMYRPYFGNVMIMTINGITIGVPVDGTTHKVPKTFAEHINARVTKVDNILKKTDNMADIARNFESNPGELEMF